MARFYFNIRKCGRTIGTDPEGTELPDVATAREEAFKSAREILSSAIRNPKPDLFDCFVIADSSGRELDTVSLKDALPKGLC